MTGTTLYGSTLSKADFEFSFTAVNSDEFTIIFDNQSVEELAVGEVRTSSIEQYTDTDGMAGDTSKYQRQYYFSNWSTLA